MRGGAIDQFESHLIEMKSPALLLDVSLYFCHQDQPAMPSGAGAGAGPN